MTRRIVLAILLIAGTFAVSAAPVEAVPDIRYVVTKKLNLRPGATAVGQRAPCPRRTRVVSGGVQLSGAENATAVVTSAPFDNRDRRRIPDDGWLASATNRSTSSQTMQTYAVCARSGRYSYLSTLVDVPTGGQTSWQLDCPVPLTGNVSIVGGGAALSGKHASIELARTTPQDGTLDVDDDRDDGWEAGMNNESGVTQRMRVWAICEFDRTYSYQENDQNQTNNNNIGFGIGCPVNTDVVGGGVFSHAIDTDVYVQGTRTFTALGPQPAGWTGTISNTSGATVSVRQTTICRAV
jgi:hypothetical protein